MTDTEKEAIIRALFQMANADEPYKRFTYISPHIKNIWRKAAELLKSK